MKKIQKIRMMAQIMFLILTIAGFFINFQITMLAVMILTFLSGVYYCGWICPYGTIQEAMSRLGKIFGFKKRKMPKSIQKYMKYSRYILLILITFISSNLIFNMLTLDPRTSFGSILLGYSVSIGALMTIISFAIISVFFERPFCNYLCYEGAKYGLMSYFRIYGIKRNTSKCVNCGKCDGACPMNISITSQVNSRSTNCINCFKCVSDCPIDEALLYGRMTMNKNEKRMYRLTFVSVLLVVLIFIFMTLTNEFNPLGNKEKLQNESSIASYAITETENQADVTVSTDDTDTGTENIIDESNPTTVSTENTDEQTDAVVSTPAPIESTDKTYTDGTYTGTGIGFKGAMEVSVTIEDDLITDVTVIDHKDDRKWFNRANKVIPNSIIESQSTDVDVVGGATYSSLGIIEGAKDALEKAK